MRKSSLIVDVRPGEYLDLSGVVQVELMQKSGQVARLRVIAPRELKIEKKGIETLNRSDASMAN